MVEQFRQREVQPSGQTPGFLQVNYSPDAFGASMGRALQQFGGSLGDFANVQARLREEKQGNDAQRQYNLASEERRQWLFDPNDGAFSQKGGNAMGVGGTTSAAMDDIRRRHLDQIEDPQTKEVFERMWLRETNQTLDSVARHELNELSTYKSETTKATLVGSIQDAYSFYNDEEAIGKALDDTRRAVAMNTQGLPPEAQAAALAEAESNIHLAALSRWAQENPYKALDYYEEHRESFTGKDHVTATSLIDAARSNRRAAETVTRWSQTSRGGDQLWSAMEFAESSGNPQAESPDGASGIMQIMPDTAREWLPKLGYAGQASLPEPELKTFLKDNPQISRLVGRTIMNDHLKTFGGDVEAALVAYNSGASRARAFLAHNAGRAPGNRDYNVPDMPWLKEETEPYVQKIMGRMGVGGTPVGTRMTRENWSLKNFQPQDLMAIQGEGQWVDARAAQGLDDLAGWMKAQFPGMEIKVNDPHQFEGPTPGKRRGTRVEYDAPSGSATHSKHFEGTAFDIQVQSWTDDQKAAFIREARARGFGGIGFYGPGGHLHIDMGRQRHWGSVPAWAKEALETPVGVAAGQPRMDGGPSSDIIGALPDGSSAASFFGPGAGTSGAFASTQGFNLTDALADAQMIADPTERERTIAMLRLEASKQEAAKEAQQSAIKQAAWDEVVRGSVKNLGPEILSQLEPSFVNSLYAYEEKKATGGPETDWSIWSNIPTDEQSLARMDVYTEYRNHLADSEFRKLVEMQRDARAKLEGSKTDSSLLANMRSRKEIIDDLAVEQKWNPKTTFGQQSIARLARNMDRYIEDAQRAKGSELSATEIQDIADKLLIKDLNTNIFGFGSQGTATEVENPDEFIAAQTWDQVQPDDQQTLIEAYRVLWNGTEPDQETAVDVYNRAMVVWLGGKPTGPDEEIETIRSALERQFNRTLSAAELERYHARYLLSYLGRNYSR